MFNHSKDRKSIHEIRLRKTINQQNQKISCIVVNRMPQIYTEHYTFNYKTTNLRVGREAVLQYYMLACVVHKHYNGVTIIKTAFLTQSSSDYQHEIRQNSKRHDTATLCQDSTLIQYSTGSATRQRL